MNFYFKSYFLKKLLLLGKANFYKVWPPRKSYTYKSWYHWGISTFSRWVLWGTAKGISEKISTYKERTFCEKGELFFDFKTKAFFKNLPSLRQLPLQYFSEMCFLGTRYFGEKGSLTTKKRYIILWTWNIFDKKVPENYFL